MSKPNRNIDGLIATEIMGWVIVGDLDAHFESAPPWIPCVSWIDSKGGYVAFQTAKDLTDNPWKVWSPTLYIADAWEVAEKAFVDWCIGPNYENGSRYYRIIVNNDPDTWKPGQPFKFGQNGDTASMTISLAALRVVGALPTKEKP